MLQVNVICEKFQIEKSNGEENGSNKKKLNIRFCGKWHVLSHSGMFSFFANLIFIVHFNILQIYYKHTYTRKRHENLRQLGENEFKRISKLFHFFRI